MFRRRTPSFTPSFAPGRTQKRAKNQSYLRKAVCESLEIRRLLTTVITDTNPLTPTPDTQTFEYKDEAGTSIRVVVHGDVSAEFVFARVDKDTNKVIFGDYVSDTNTTEQGRDLFHIYIAQGTIDSYISIAEVPAPSTDAGTPRPMEPFTGGRTLYINQNFGTDHGVTTSDGAVYIGATTLQPTGSQDQTIANHPIVSAHYNGQGIFPANAKGRLVSGITTAPGVSMGNIMIGGTVTGEVYIGGSIQTFYCGDLLTGTTNGQNTGTPGDPGNFYVQGDMRNLLVMGSIGTTNDGFSASIDGRKHPVYWAGTDIAVHGRVGQIKTGNAYLASGIVYNDNTGLGLRTRQQEIETIDPQINRGEYTDFENGQFGDNQAFFSNNSLDTAQYLGSINSKQTGNNSIQLNGLFQYVANTPDTGDFYAVALMAGQTVGVRIIAPSTGTAGTAEETKSLLHVGVFDPEGRLIDSDFSNNTDTTTLSRDSDPAQQEYFSFTAAMPGIYKFAVGEDAPTFSSPSVRLGDEQPYQMQITGVGNIGLGGLVASSTIFSASGTSPNKNSSTGQLADIEVIHGDLGSIISLNDFIYSPGGGLTGIDDGGDFRDIEAQSMGQTESAPADDGTGGSFTGSAEILAITGSVGLIRTNGIDPGADCTNINPESFNGINSKSIAQIKGNIQYIVAPNYLLSGLACDGSIGVVQVAQFGVQPFPGSLSANADAAGKPADIDLIDVTKNLGTLQGGGPVISAGPGGDVRYIHIADSSTAYRPVLFGGSQPEQTTFVQGQSATFTDDSGAQVRVVPTIEEPFVVNGVIQVDPGTLEPLNNSGTLTVLTYPIARGPTDRGGGGLAILRIDSTRGVTVNVTGGSAEIGSIRAGQSTDQTTGKLNGTTDQGPGLVFDDQFDSLNGDRGNDAQLGTGDDPFELDPTSTDTQSILLNGTRTDVFSIEGPNFNKIQNRTGGEIVNTNIGTVNVLSGTTLGIASSSFVPGMAVEGVAVADNPGTSEVEGDTFPFLHAKNAIVINGGIEGNPAVVDLDATESIGNVMIVGRAENIVANSDNKGVKGVFEGIAGAIYAKGQLRNIQIGEGLQPSGTGNMGVAGIYCAATTPSQDVLPGNTDPHAPGLGRIERVTNQGAGSDIRGDIVSDSGIGTVSLTNGSIINSDIMIIEQTMPTQTGADFQSSQEFDGTGAIVEDPGHTIGNIDNITVRGTGGIIGLLAVAANIGPVTETGGFGIINSAFSILGDGRFAAVSADGYGIRGDTWEGGQSLDSLTANGDGKRLTTSGFESSVLFSGSLAVDPYFGTRPNGLTDLYVVTGTTPAAPKRKGVSASGSIDESTILVSRNVNSIKANTMRLDLFNIANSVGTIETDDYADSVILTCGTISTIAIGKDALRDDLEIAGPVGTVEIGGAFRGSSHISASGQNGSIGTFVTHTTLYGNVYAQAGIGTIRVGTDYGSQGTYTPKGIDQFIVGGDFLSDALLTVGPKDRASQGHIRKLVITGDLEDGGVIRLHSFGTKTILGQEIGLVDIYPWE